MMGHLSYLDIKHGIKSVSWFSNTPARKELNVHRLCPFALDIYHLARTMYHLKLSATMFSMFSSNIGVYDLKKPVDFKTMLNKLIRFRLTLENLYPDNPVYSKMSLAISHLIVRFKTCLRNKRYKL